MDTQTARALDNRADDAVPRHVISFRLHQKQTQVERKRQAESDSPNDRTPFSLHQPEFYEQSLRVRSKGPETAFHDARALPVRDTIENGNNKCIRHAQPCRYLW